MTQEEKKKKRKGKHVIERNENVGETRELCWSQIVKGL